MVKENMFNVEKHLNDTLHNPQARGRSHTDKEIVAARHVLGRPDPPASSASGGDTPADVRERGEALGDGGVLLQQRGLVVRVDTASLPKPKEKRKRGPPEKLDANNRGNMMTRIQAGGTGGPGPSRAAAAFLSGQARDDSDEDAPMIVCPEELSFQEGWAGGTDGDRLLEAAAAAASTDIRGTAVGHPPMLPAPAGGENPQQQVMQAGPGGNVDRDSRSALSSSASSAADGDSSGDDSGNEGDAGEVPAKKRHKAEKKEKHRREKRKGDNRKKRTNKSKDKEKRKRSRKNDKHKKESKRKRHRKK